MNTGTHPRTATLALGLALGLSLLTPLTTPAGASTAPTAVGGPAVTAPAGPEALGDVAAQPVPGERERASLAEAATGLPQYEVVDLGGGHAGFAAEVNEHGAIAGTIFPEGTDAAGRHAVPAVWQGGVRTALDTGGVASPIIHAGAIGDDGTVGGWEFDVATRTRYAVRWVPDRNGVYGPKERISEVRHADYDGTGGEVQTINSDGVLHVTAPKQHVPTYSDMVWDDGAITEVPGIPGQYPYAETWDMNEFKELAGSLSTGTRMDAAVWSAGGGPRVLPRLIEKAYLNQALALNDDGDVVVESFHPGGNEDLGEDRRVIAVHEQGSWTRLPELYGDDDRNSNLFPTDINNRGDVVGEALIGFSDRETTFAWLYRDGQMIDLNTLVPEVEGWELNAAYSINERGQITGVGTLNGVRRPFLLDPTRPLLFVPGAGASILKSYEEDPDRPRELWVGCGEDRMLLSSFPEDLPARDVRAVDATRYMDCYGFSGRHVPMLDAYGTMLDKLTGQYGYREYQVEERVERFTTDGCDLSQRSEAPNLFVFAYDWRADNRLSADKLADFIGCIQLFYPETEIDVLTHSMGSLVVRRHILNTGAETSFHKVVTVGAPWLGAPKLVNVLNTGNFAPPVASGPEVAHIVSGFPAAHQLMSGPLYHQYVDSAFEEDGWDYDGDGNAREKYDWPNLEETFDRRWSRTTPAATAQQFQDFGGADGQADWSADTSGIDYVHIYGVQSGENTLGRTIATTDTSCSWLPPFRCVTRNVYESVMTEGDQTVPTMSADRLVPGADLNADTATLVRIDGTGWLNDHSVEHTSLTRHPDALRAMINAFYDQDAQLSRMVATADTTAPAPYRYVTVTGGADVVLSDGQGNSDEPLGPGVRVPLPGTQHLGQGEGSELVTMPSGADHPWTVDFVGRGEPMTVEMLDGTQSDPRTAMRWRDLVLDGGQAAALEISATGVERLRIDTDEDGVVDQVVPPTSDVSGSDATDTEAPVVSLATTPVLGQQRLTINATDGRDGSGVETIWYATDERGDFSEYDGPFVTSATTVRAFAEDRAGNRSTMVELDVADADRGPLTRAVLDPAPNEAGWSAGTTAVRLVASAGDSPVTEIRWRTTGAQATEETVVPGAETEVTVTEPGQTTLWFQAVAEDGTVEPWRQQVVRLDATAPTSRLRTPAPGAVVSSLTQLAGTAADDESGVTSVEVLLERTSDGAVWDGDSWEAEPTWLAAGGSTSWRTTSVPTGADFTTGGYAVRVRVTDGAGRVATSPADTFTMAYAGRLSVVGLDPVPGLVGYTSALDVDDRGVAVGLTHETGTLWRNGTGEQLVLPAGIAEVVPTAIGPDGSVAGHSAYSGAPGRAVRWDPSGTPHVLPSLPGDPVNVTASDISAAGVVGSAGTQPVWWPTDDRAVPLPLGPGDQGGSAEGIDDHGTIVGSVTDADDVSRAAVWTDEGRTLTVLGTLGGEGSYATAVNEVGQVVGSAQRADRSWRPFVTDLWSGEPMSEVYVPSHGGAVPHDIADNGTIVGEYTNGAGDSQGFAVVDGQFRAPWDLIQDDSPWSVHRIRAVNEQGQMTGFGWNGTRYSGFLATTPHAPTAQDAVVDTDAGTPVEVTLTGTDPDPGTTLTHEVVVPPSHGTLSELRGDRVTYTPDPGFTGTDHVGWRTTDGTLGSNAALVTIRVRPGSDTNQRPVAMVTAPATAPEGSVVQLDGSASYDTDGAVASYAWDLDGDGEHDDATGVSAELAVPREGLRTVSLRVTDGEGATGSIATTVTVVNVAPLVSVPPTADAAAGNAVELTGSFSDPGEDEWTATVDTGAGHVPLTLDGRGFVVTTTFDEPGDHPVEVRVCDGTDCGAATTVVTVRDRLAARIEAPATAQEGDRIDVDGTGSTGSPAAYGWDLDGDGQYDDASGGTASVVLDQDDEHTIGLQVTDAEGRTATSTHTVTVANVLPVVGLPATATAVAGEPWTLGGSFTDPGDDAWSATVDTGAGAVPLPLLGRSFQVAHTFATAGTRSVPVTVCDDDGCATATVVVTVTASQPAPWPWQGFFAPVDPMPVVNTVKAGQAVPMKFSLGGDRGLAIFAEGSPVSVRHGCDTSGGTDAIESTTSAGASELTYDAETGRYHYVWKTMKAWAGQCRTFRMTLVDGSVHEAEFRLR